MSSAASPDRSPGPSANAPRRGKGRAATTPPQLPTLDAALTERFWELTFDAVPDAIAIIDRQHRILRVNRAMAERLNRPPGECIGQICHICIHGLTEPPDFCPHSRLLREGTEQEEVVVEARLGGTFLVTTSPLRDQAGAILGSVHVARDITERKRMEDQLLALNQELQKTNADLKEAYRWMRDNRDRLKKNYYRETIAFLVDREGRIEGATEAALEWSGRSRFAVTDGTVLELIAEGDRTRVGKALGRAWFGMTLPFRVMAPPTAASAQEFELKLTRITTRGERRLLLELQPPVRSGPEHPQPEEAEKTSDSPIR